MTGLISSRSAVLDISPGSCSHNLSQLLTERSASFRPHTQNPVRGFPVPQSHVQMVRRSSAVASAPWPRLDILGQRERSPDFLFCHYLILIGFITWPRCTDDDRRRLMSAVTSPAPATLRQDVPFLLSRILPPVSSPTIWHSSF